MNYIFLQYSSSPVINRICLLVLPTVLDFARFIYIIYASFTGIYNIYCVLGNFLMKKILHTKSKVPEYSDYCWLACGNRSLHQSMSGPIR